METKTQTQLTGSLTIPRFPFGLLESAKRETIKAAIKLDVEVEFPHIKKRLFSKELEFVFTGEKQNVAQLFDYVDSFEVTY